MKFQGEVTDTWNDRAGVIYGRGEMSRVRWKDTLIDRVIPLSFWDGGGEAGGNARAR